MLFFWFVKLFSRIKQFYLLYSGLEDNSIIRVPHNLLNANSQLSREHLLGLIRKKAKITKIKLHICFKPSSFNKGNFTIKSIITLLYSCSSSAKGYNNL